MGNNICPVCGKEFIPHGPNQKICGSAECRRERVREYRRNTVVGRDLAEKICMVCGKRFQPKNRRQVTCGGEYGERLKRIRKRERYQPKQKKRIPVSAATAENCLCCGKPLHGNSGYGNFCCESCYSAYDAKTAWRELYPGTAGLIRKWYGEGWPVWQIAQVLGRHHSQVEEVLER